MKTLLCLTGVAALALSAPALAKGGPGGGHGGGNPHGGGGGPPGGAPGGGPHGGGNGHGGGNPHFEGGNPHGGGGPVADFGGGLGKGHAQRVEHAPMHVQQAGGRHVEKQARRDDRRGEMRRIEAQDRGRGHEDRRVREARGLLPLPQANSGWNDGFRSAGGCLPPGQAKKLYHLGERVPASWNPGYALPAAYRDFYPDGADYAYRYDDSGYIYRVDRQSNLISGLIPLLGGGFGVGQALPAGYDVYNLPFQYRDLYRDGPDAAYRYGDDAIYQVDPQSGMIESVVALLTGGNLGIGQALPSGFDAYNLPLQYRDDYQDGPDAIYRYADGNIYQADPKTQIIEAIISALT